MNEKPKIILTDADGVLFNWIAGFNTFMEMRGHTALTQSEYSVSKKYNIPKDVAFNLIKEYNEGPLIEFLEPFRDSKEYVKKLADHGFRFVCVTSLSNNPEAGVRRIKNIKNIFGDVFDEVHCIGMGELKFELLNQKWKDTDLFWIEDTTHQAEAGLAAGLKPVLIKHSYNEIYPADKFVTVSNETPWVEIYNLICAEYGIQS
jgi:FMN phosphatase YigB (HAD superfamily)